MSTTEYPTVELVPQTMNGLEVQGVITQYPNGISVNIFTWLDDGTTLSAESFYKRTIINDNRDVYRLIAPATLAWSGADEDEEDTSTGLDDDLKEKWERISDSITYAVELGNWRPLS